MPRDFFPPSQDAELTNLKESEVEDLSLQLAAKILKAPANLQLKMFRDLTHNFPSVARYEQWKKK